MDRADEWFFELDRDPTLIHTFGVLAVTDEPLDQTAVTGMASGLGQLLPRLRCRVVPGTGGGLEWREDPWFRGSHQVWRVRLPDGARLAAALEVVEQFYAAPFEPDRPPWGILFVPRVDGSRSLLFMRFHHGIADGLGFLGQLDGELSTGAGSERRYFPARHARDWWGTSGAASTRLAGAAVRFLAAARDCARFLAGAERPLEELRRALAHRRLERAGRSFAGRQRALSRRFVGMSCPVEVWTRRAQALCGTRNDLYVAIVAETARGSLRACGLGDPTLRVVLPLGRERHATRGNTAARGLVELTDADLETGDLKATHAKVEWAKSPQGDPTPDLVGRLDALLPVRQRTRRHAEMLALADTVASNLAFARLDQYLPIRALENMAFAPAMGNPLTCLMMGGEERVSIGVTVDTGLVDLRAVETALRGATHKWLGPDVPETRFLDADGSLAG